MTICRGAVQRRQMELLPLCEMSGPCCPWMWQVHPAKCKLRSERFPGTCVLRKCSRVYLFVEMVTSNLLMYVCVLMCACEYVCMYIPVCLCRCICDCVHICVPVHVCACACAHVGLCGHAVFLPPWTPLSGFCSLDKVENRLSIIFSQEAFLEKL